MLLDPYDVLEQLSDFMGHVLTWCDLNGEVGNGIHSISSETLVRMRNCVDAAALALAEKKLVRFPPVMDATRYLNAGDKLIEKLEIV